MSEGSGGNRSSAGLAMAAAVAAAAALFVWSEHRLVGHAGFPLDDAWIHMQMARNMSLGLGMYFNPGDPVSASSAPLWTLLLAGLHLLPWDVIVSAKVVGVALLWGAGMATAALGRSLGLTPGWAAGAGIVLVLSPRLVWGGLSGMEVPLYTLLATAGIWQHVRSFGTRPALASTVLFACASLARPDCLVLFPLAILDRWRRCPSRSVWRSYRFHLLLFAGILAPALAFNLATIGRPLPNTYYAKVGEFGLIGALANGDYVTVAKTLGYYPLQQLQELVQLAVADNLVLACLVPVGFLHLLALAVSSPPTSSRPAAADRKSALVLLALVGLPLLRGVLAPFHGPLFQHGRYVGFLFPLLTLVGVIGVRQALHALARSGPFPRMRRVAAWGPVLVWGVLAVNIAGLQLQYARTYAANVADIDRMHVATGRWLAQNTSEEEVLATHDIGAIGYFSGRRVIDTSGLVTPAILPYLQPGQRADIGVLAFLEQARPDYLVVMPSWYPDLVRLDDHFEPVHETVLEARSIAAGDRLVVFRTIWSSGG